MYIFSVQYEKKNFYTKKRNNNLKRVLNKNYIFFSVRIHKNGNILGLIIFTEFKIHILKSVTKSKYKSYLK